MPGLQVEAITELKHHYFLVRFGRDAGDACVDWAVTRLGNDEEGDDLDIVLLASARGREEVLPLVEAILARYCGPGRLSDAQVLAGVTAAFGALPRPAHFTNFTHCDECAEHDQTLRAKGRDELTRDDLGSLGWDPVTFCDSPAKAYLLPRLARELVAEPDRYRGWYGPQLIGHLYRPASENEFLQYCSQDQRSAVAVLLRQVLETRTDLVESENCHEDLMKAIEQWGTPCQ